MSDDSPMVFILNGQEKCADCGVDLPVGTMARFGEDRILCLKCAGLARLVFLPSGDAALTRRARKHSKLSAVVLEFNRRRRRSERRGLLVEKRAVKLAGEECRHDGAARAKARERAGVLRAKQDAEYVEKFARKIGDRYPGCPQAERDEIAGHACRKYSGRVGRSAAAKEFSPEAIDLAVRARIRHAHTRYDGLLASGVDKYEARRGIRDELEKVVDRWKKGGA